MDRAFLRLIALRLLESAALSIFFKMRILSARLWYLSRKFESFIVLTLSFKILRVKLGAWSLRAHPPTLGQAYTNRITNNAITITTPFATQSHFGYVLRTSFQSNQSIISFLFIPSSIILLTIDVK